MGIDPASATATVAGVGVDGDPALAATGHPPGPGPFDGGDVGAWLVALLTPVVTSQGMAPDVVVLTHNVATPPTVVEEVRRASTAAGVGAHTVTRAEATAAWADARTPAPDGTVLVVVDLGGTGGEAVVLRRDGGWFRPAGGPVAAGPASGPLGVDLGGLAAAAAAAGRTPATVDAVFVLGGPEVAQPFIGALVAGGAAFRVEPVPDGAVALGAALVGRAHLRSADATPAAAPGMVAPTPVYPVGPSPEPGSIPPFLPPAVPPVGGPGGARRGPLLVIAAVVTLLALVIGVVAFTGDDGDEEAGPETTEDDGEDDDEPTTTEAPTTTATTEVVPAEGGTLVLGGIDEPINWNPAHVEATTGSATLAAAIFPAAFRVAPDGTVLPDLGAIQGELVQADPQLVRYEILPGAEWSDGVPITVDDFDYTARMQSGDDPVATPLSTDGWADIAAIREAGDNVVEVELSQPYADWDLLFSPLLPAHALRDGAGFNEGLRTVDADTVTAGPFVIESYVPGESVTLVANPDVAGFGPALDAIEVRFDTFGAEATAFQAGELDVAVVDGATGAEVDATELEFTVAESYEQLTFNLANPLLAEPAVRQAIAAAVDRDVLAEAVAEVEPLVAGRVDSRVSTPGRPDYVAQGPDASDTGLARTTLEAAGFVLGADGIYARDGQRLSFRLASTDSPRRQRALELLTVSLGAAGIEVLPTALGTVEFFTLDLPPDGTLPDFDIALFAFTATAGGSTGFADVFGTDGRNNAGGYSSPAADAALAAIDAQLDRATRGDMLNELDAILWADLPNLPLYGVGTAVLVGDQVEEVFANGFIDGPFWNVEDWTLTG
ncbi:MAG: ABC transporter substrate-binding protein [Acidimicrobiales bacterium]